MILSLVDIQEGQLFPQYYYMVATHPYSQNPAKNGYFDMAFQPLGYQME